MIRGIEHIGITVTDLGQAEAFFCQALGASVLYRLVASDNPDQTITGDKMSPLNGFPAEMNLTGLAMLRLAATLNSFRPLPLFRTNPPVLASRELIISRFIQMISIRPLPTCVYTEQRCLMGRQIVSPRKRVKVTRRGLA